MDRDPPEGSGIELDLMELPDLPELQLDAVPDGAGEKDTFSDVLVSLQREMKSGEFLCSFAVQIIEINKKINEASNIKDVTTQELNFLAIALDQLDAEIKTTGLDQGQKTYF